MYGRGEVLGRRDSRGERYFGPVRGRDLWLVGEGSRGGRKKDLFVFRRVEQALPYCRFNNSTGYMGMAEDNSDNRMGFTIMKTGARVAITTGSWQNADRPSESG